MQETTVNGQDARKARLKFGTPPQVDKAAHRFSGQGSSQNHEDLRSTWGPVFSREENTANNVQDNMAINSGSAPTRGRINTGAEAASI